MHLPPGHLHPFLPSKIRRYIVDPSTILSMAVVQYASRSHQNSRSLGINARKSPNLAFWGGPLLFGHEEINMQMSLRRTSKRDIKRLGLFSTLHSLPQNVTELFHANIGPKSRVMPARGINYGNLDLQKHI